MLSYLGYCPCCGRGLRCSAALLAAFIICCFVSFIFALEGSRDAITQLLQGDCKGFTFMSTACFHWIFWWALGFFDCLSLLFKVCVFFNCSKGYIPSYNSGLGTMGKRLFGEVGSCFIMTFTLDHMGMRLLVSVPFDKDCLSQSTGKRLRITWVGAPPYFSFLKGFNG